MKSVVLMLLVLAALAVIVRLFNAKSRLGQAVLLVLLLWGGWKWVSHRDLSLAGQVGRDAVASEQAAPSSPLSNEASSPGEVLAASFAVSSDGGEDEQGTGNAIALDEEPVIEVEPEEGQPVRAPLPQDRLWVDAEPKLEGSVHQVAVSSGPHESERECRRALERELQRAVNEYVDWHLGRVYGDRFKASTFVHYDGDYIRTQLVNARTQPAHEYAEVIKFSFGPMHQLHALLNFTPEFRAQLDGKRADIDRQWREVQQSGRLLGGALGFGLLLALLGVVFGYFRLDTATRGFYTGRLQMVATAAILAVVAAGFVLARQLHWPM